MCERTKIISGVYFSGVETGKAQVSHGSDRSIAKQSKKKTIIDTNLSIETLFLSESKYFFFFFLVN